MPTTEEQILPTTPEEAVTEAPQEQILPPEEAPQISLEERTYHGIVFESPEAVALAKEEEQRLEDVMRNLSRDDLASIDNAIAQVSTSPSPIKKLYLDTLQRFRMDILQSDCAYRGVLYESPAHAEHAKQMYAWAQGIYNSLNRTDEASVKAARDHLASTNHKAVTEFVDQLDKILGQLDAQKRTVDGITFETAEEADTARQELAQIQAALADLQADDEPALLRAKEMLTACTTRVRDKYLTVLEQHLAAYDLKLRTFRGKVYETREEASTLEQESVKVREILTAMDQTNEASMLEAKAGLEELTTELKNDPLATVTQLLEEYDLRLRTFNGVLYGTREEAIAIAVEYQTAVAIRQKVDPENEESILQAKEAMSALNTSVKDEHLQQLTAMWEAYDKKLRTFGNIIFETREDAQLARDTYQEFMNQFNSMDLEQGANLVILDNYITNTLHERLRDYARGMVSNVRMVQSRIDYILRTHAAIDPATHKQESADLYHFIDETVPMMVKYRMNTDTMETLKKKHYASLNVGKKFLRFFKK